MPPTTTLLTFPDGYGTATNPIEWPSTRKRLEEATVYWIASVRPDCRPHVVPRDGVWIDDALWYGGSADTVHNRNISANPEVVVSIGGGLDAVIVEGRVDHTTPSQELAEQLAAASMEKYPQYGKVDPAMYTEHGVSVLRPRRVLAWNSFPADATRFIFEQPA